MRAQIGHLQSKLREGTISSKDNQEVLKSELRRRDETIQKLRRDVLLLQEKRDSHQAEVTKPFALRSDLHVHVRPVGSRICTNIMLSFTTNAVMYLHISPNLPIFFF